MFERLGVSLLANAEASIRLKHLYSGFPSDCGDGDCSKFKMLLKRSGGYISIYRSWDPASSYLCLYFRKERKDKL